MATPPTLKPVTRPSSPEIYRAAPGFCDLVDATGYAIVVLDLEGRILEFNPAAERLHRCRREQAIGETYVTRFVPEEGRNAASAHLARVLVDGEDVRDIELTIRTDDGHTRVVWWNGTPLRDDEGATIGSIGIGRDVTELGQGV